MTDFFDDHFKVIHVTFPKTETTCRYCGRRIIFQDRTWIDPEATGDDKIWRETCDANDAFMADHEPNEEG